MEDNLYWEFLLWKETRWLRKKNISRKDCKNFPPLATEPTAKMTVPGIPFVFKHENRHVGAKYSQPYLLLW